MLKTCFTNISLKAVGDHFPTTQQQTRDQWSLTLTLTLPQYDRSVNSFSCNESKIDLQKAEERVKTFSSEETVSLSNDKTLVFVVPNTLK